MNTAILISFLNKLTARGILSAQANDKIQDYLAFRTNFFGKLFLVLTGIIGALFASAAIFELICHNWDDLPKHLRGVMSLIPVLIALVFYFLALFRHKENVVWVEASSMFVFLMIGASMALITNTYQMNEDITKFMMIWLLCAVPLFYIARASGIAILYLGMSCYFLYPEVSWFWGFGVERNEDYMLFWLFFFLFLPHFFMILNFKERRQSIRAIYLGWCIALCLYLALPVAFQGGWLYWALTLLLLYMVVGNRFFGQNLSILGKPFQFVALWAIFHSLLSASNPHGLNYIFELENLSYMEELTNSQMMFYWLGLIILIGSTALAFMTIRKKSIIHKSITYLPILIGFMMFIHYMAQWDYFDVGWLGRLVFNIYVLGFGVTAMILGNRQKNMAALFYGLFLICFLLWARYFDMDIAFWLKGIIFLCVSGMFFFINFVFWEDVDSSAGHLAVSRDGNNNDNPDSELKSIEKEEE
jgi:uncharacterized membrane protein